MPIEQMVLASKPHEAAGGASPADLVEIGASPDVPELARRALPQVAASLAMLVCHRAGQRAVAAEGEWRAQTAEGTDPPAELLKTFPPVWRYVRLQEDLYALLRARCLGRPAGQDRYRAMVQALVFSPEELAPCGGHPLALATSGVWFETPADVGPTLRALPVLPGAKPPSMDILAQAPYEAHLDELLAATVRASGGQPSLLVVVPEAEETPALVAALLAVLPPSARANKTFCTQLADVQAARAEDLDDILALSGEHADAAHLSRSGYEASAGGPQFCVMDFEGDRFAQGPPPGAYARVLAAALRGGRPEGVHRVHEAIEALDLAGDPARWDDLAGLARTDDAHQAGRSVQAMVQLATDETRAARALELLRPRVRELARADGPAALSAIAGHLQSLVNRTCDAVNAHAAQAGQAFVTELSDLAAEALKRGAVRQAMSLMQSSGRARNDMLIRIVCEQFSPEEAELPAPRGPADQQELVHLLLDALRRMDPSAMGAQSMARMYRLVFEAAAKVDKVPEVWSDLGPSRLQPFFESPPQDPSKLGALQRIAELLPKHICSDAYLWANMVLLRAQAPADRSLTDEVASRLTNLAAATAHARDSQSVSRDVLNSVHDLVAEPGERAEALGRMAGAILKTPVGNELLEAFHQACRSAPGGRAAVLERLAGAGATDLLVQEFFSELVPFKADSEPAYLRCWQPLVGHWPALRSRLRAALAARLEETDAPGELLPLAERLLAESVGDVPPPAEKLRLARAVAEAMDVEPWPGGADSVLLAGLAELDDAATAKLRAIRFVTIHSARTALPDWGIESFPADDPDWAAVAELAPAAQAQAVRWGLNALEDVGPTSAAQAERLAEILAAAGLSAPRPVAEAFRYLLQDRDPVTWIQTLTAVGDAAAGRAMRSALLAGAFVDLVAALEPAYRQLLSSHLSDRFGRWGEDHLQRLAELCEQAGLTEAFSEDDPAEADELAAEEPDGADYPPASAGLLGRVAAFFGRRPGEPTPPEPPAGDADADADAATP